MNSSNTTHPFTLSLDTLAAADLLVLKARAFGRAAHDSIGQKRKYSVAPYWTHTERVAEAVAIYTGNPFLVAGSLLHDVGEDVAPKNAAFSLEVIRAEFGAEVASLVHDLTDQYTVETCPSFPFAQRKDLEGRRLEQVSDAAKTIRLADITDNVRDFTKYDPDFAVVYKRELVGKVAGLRAPAVPGNERLYDLAVAALGESPNPTGPGP